MSARRDRRLIYAAVFLRAMATSAIGVTLGAYFAALDLDPGDSGVIAAVGLAGAALAALIATVYADRIGRRAFLLVITACGVAGTVMFALVSTPLALCVAAALGMINSMGRDRGAALILEAAALPSTATDAERTRVLAVYTMLQDIGHAIGALLAGVPALLVESLGPVQAHGAVMLVCAALGVVGLVLYLALGPAIEQGRAARPTLSPHSRTIVTKITALFALDSLGGGFLPAWLLSYFFFTRFDAPELSVSLLFFGARVMNAASHLGAAWLAKRIGLVNTMVFTHIPSSLLLVTVAFAPTFPIAAVLFLLREGLVEMDVPTRQSYVMAVVEPHERTLASGITNLVRIAAWAVAPAIAGLFVTDETLYLPLVVGAAMKITYDVLLWRAFRGVRPPEER